MAHERLPSLRMVITDVVSENLIYRKIYKKYYIRKHTMTLSHTW